MADAVSHWFETHPKEAKSIIQKVMDAASAREAARKARDLTRRKGVLDVSAPCPASWPTARNAILPSAEIFIVEGDSAGGSAKQGRDRKFQAILPLKGKILNVERARFDRMLGSAEIGTLITALGTGIGRGEPEQGGFDIKKLRYHRINIMTDADVDGSHIRTLLLTFFFRQMPELIERGHLYIAQPPLYRAKRGNDERYLKNDDALEDFLLDKALAEARLAYADGRIFQGDDMRGELAWLREAAAKLRGLAASVPTWLLEQAAIAGALVADPAQATARMTDLVNRLNTVSSATERTWLANADDRGLHFARTVRGVAERYVLDAGSLRSSEARWLAERTEALSGRFKEPATLALDKAEAKVAGPATAFDRILTQGRKGLAIQRFKGLGEMNPDQLWKTTLDPEIRTLLQVRVGDVEDAAQIFSTLMGDVVEPRRDFIVGNALKVANLDV